MYVNFKQKDKRHAAKQKNFSRFYGGFAHLRLF